MPCDFGTWMARSTKYQRERLQKIEAEMLALEAKKEQLKQDEKERLEAMKAQYAAMYRGMFLRH